MPATVPAANAITSIVVQCILILPTTLGTVVNCHPGLQRRKPRKVTKLVSSRAEIPVQDVRFHNPGP